MWGVQHLDPQQTWSLRFVEWCLNEDILCNSLELCAWTFPLLYSAYTEDHQGDSTLPARFLSAVTGWEITIDELHRTVAPRVAALERMIRCREGRTAEDDIFQEEVFKLPWVQGWLTKDKSPRFHVRSLRRPWLAAGQRYPRAGDVGEAGLGRHRYRA